MEMDLPLCLCVVDTKPAYFKPQRTTRMMIDDDDDDDDVVIRSTQTSFRRYECTYTSWYTCTCTCSMMMMVMFRLSSTSGRTSDC